MESIFDFIHKFSGFLKTFQNNQFLVYSNTNESGSVLLRNNANNKRYIFKKWETELQIGRNKLVNFIGNTSMFKGHKIDNYIFFGYNFRDNAKSYSRIDNNLTMIECDLKMNQFIVIGSRNIEPILLEALIAFSEQINFDIVYDFEGMLKHSGFNKGNPKIEKVDSVQKSPKVFISYSWDDESHQKWVLKLAADLIKNGIIVLIDEWDLEKYNNDLHLFMESGIRESDHVIIICTDNYRHKANNRVGGVGVENTIITGDIHINSLKYIPIVKNYNEVITDSLPTYLITKSVLDFKEDSKYDLKMEELLRKLLNVPKYQKPELGKLPQLKSHSF